MKHRRASAIMAETTAARDWMVYFASGRIPSDRGFYEREGNIALPADGELTDDADEFAVLYTQLLRRGLIPGFPDGFGRRYTPRSTIIAQNASSIDFSKRASVCGLAFLRDEFVNAGAVDHVISGRPDLHFENLLGWDTGMPFARRIGFRAPDYECDSTLGMPLLDPASPFTSIGVIVDGDDQATTIRDLLTSQFLSLRSYDPLVRQTRKLLRDAFILLPSRGRCSDVEHASISGLEGFVMGPAISVPCGVLRQKVLADWALKAARENALQYARNIGCPFDPDDHATSYLGYVDDGSPMSSFLMSSGLADTVDGGVNRLDIDIDVYGVPAKEYEVLDVAAAVLAEMLALQVYVVRYL